MTTAVAAVPLIIQEAGNREARSPMMKSQRAAPVEISKWVRGDRFLGGLADGKEGIIMLQK